MSLQLSFGQFYGIDTIVEFFTIIVSLIISYYSHKIYSIIKDGNYKFFSWAFLSIAVALVFKIVSNITILHTVKIQKLNFLITLFHESEVMEVINFVSFILYKALFIAGFLFLFLIITKTKKKEGLFLFGYLGLITILFSIYFNFVFHLTLVIVLAYLVIHFYENYKTQNTRNSFFVFFAFLVILISQFSFAFDEINPIFYLAGEILLLVGFLTLLLNQMKLQNEKTNKVRSDKRHALNFKRK